MVNKLPIGIDSFRQIREDSRYYVDKTLLIRDFIQNGDYVALITRPLQSAPKYEVSMRNTTHTSMETSMIQLSVITISSRYTICFSTEVLQRTFWKHQRIKGQGIAANPWQPLSRGAARRNPVHGRSARQKKVRFGAQDDNGRLTQDWFIDIKNIKAWPPAERRLCRVVLGNFILHGR